MRDLRDVLRRAGSVPEPRVERLLAGLPAVLARARAQRDGPPEGRLVAASRAWLPRLAGATAIAVAVAALASVASAPASGSALESWIVTGAAPASTSDPVLDALLEEARP